MKGFLGRHSTQCYAFLAGALIGGCAVWGIFYVVRPKPVPLSGLRESDLTSQSPYHFIDPLIALKGFDSTASAKYVPLQRSIQSFVNVQEKQGALQAGSVYFKDLNTSGGFMLNPDEKYAPASLLKVPLMIAYFKLAGGNPTVLDTALIYTGPSANAGEHFISPMQLTRGNTYSVEDLIDHMIENSDNNAAQMLTDNLNAQGQADAINSLFADLGISQVDIGSDFMTIRAYSLFFRVLYNATYLDRDYSERALDLLSRTDFTDGISLGVPNAVEVAQKFGEFTKQDSNGVVLERELNNCGIIYYPSHPYMLCVMTKGPDFSQLGNAIGTISKQTYQFTETLYGTQSQHL